MSRSHLLAAALALSSAAASADPGYYVVTPYDNEGLRFVDFRYWTVKPNQRTEVVWPELGFGYGVSSRWTTELFLSWEGSAHEAVRPNTLNWQNEFLFTQGQWPWDLALHTQLIEEREAPHRTTVEWGPVLQADLWRTQFNVNLFFDRAFPAEQAAPTMLKYQWQVRYRWHPRLHFGLQGFGELGPWDHWAPRARQSHRAGPAVFTTLRLNDREAIKLQAAWLVGSTFARSGHMFTMRADWEF